MANILNPRRQCPECGRTFSAHHGKMAFCTPAHQRQFHDRNSSRGKVLLPLLQVWRRGKHGQTDDTRYALEQICKLADAWNMEDRAAGRMPELIVAGKRAAGWSAVDLA